MKLREALQKKVPKQRVKLEKAVNPAIYHKKGKLEVNNWVVSDFVVSTLVPVVGTHPFPLDELMLLTASVCYLKPKVIFEWGTHIGKSARAFHEISTHFGINSKIHSFDLPDDVEHNEHPHEQRGMLVKGLPVMLHQEDGVEGSIRISQKNYFKGEEILFFVDGDHSYESVSRELKLITKNHGEPNILLHDTLYQADSSSYNIGPWKAIQEHIAKHKSYDVLSTNFGLPGMTLLYKSK